MSREVKCRRLFGFGWIYILATVKMTRRGGDLIYEMRVSLFCCKQQIGNWTRERAKVKILAILIFRCFWSWNDKRRIGGAGAKSNRGGSGEVMVIGWYYCGLAVDPKSKLISFFFPTIIFVCVCVCVSVSDWVIKGRGVGVGAKVILSV